ncbi:MAG: hypothetical protein A2X18_02205 [Bacteroidetes bacterium GWF2_40_14]|nr:MAG: hypothetical protein A2X18_02205 [Bacteroidetes bacterium GWF2_40_14]
MNSKTVPKALVRLLPFVAFFLFFCNEVSAQKININFKETPLKTVINEVSRQTGYDFVYSNALTAINDRISISYSASGEPIEKLFNLLFSQRGISFKINKKQVTLAPKEIVPGNPNKGSSTQEIKKQEKITIRGRILDDSQLPLPGVSIFNLMSKKGSYSDNYGDYTIEVSNGDRLRFTSIGMTAKEIVIIGTGVVYNVEMTNENVLLQNVVVTGYQSISKDRAAGAVSIMNASEIQSRPSINLASAMDGMFTGLRVYGEGGSEKFTIRGIGTMTMGISNPLVVVDGFAVEDGLNSINPNDIETVHVLKDASAASIWGARSSNGVIVITTKRAKKGLHVKFNSFLSIQDKMDLAYANPIASSADALRWERYLWDYDKTWPSFSISRDVDGNNNPVTLGITLLNMRDLGRISQSEFNQKWSALEQTDYKDDVYKYIIQNPITQNYDVSVNGTSEKNQYIFNIRYTQDQSNFKDNSNRDILTNFRNIYNVTPWLDFNFSIMTRFSRSNNSGASLSDIKSMSPYERLVDDSGDDAVMVGSHYQEFVDAVDGIFPKDWNYNLLREIRNREILSKQNILRLQSSLTFKLIKGLTYETKFQYEQYKTENSSYYSEDSYYVRDQINKWVDYDEPNKKILKRYVPDGGQLLKSYGNTSAFNFGNQLKYNQEFGKHQITAGLFSEISSKVNESYGSPTVYGYDPDLLTSQVPEIYYPIHSYWGATTYTMNGMDANMRYTDDRFFSVLGNGAYTYNQKYSLTGSFRIDASNLIVKDPKYRYAPFWSVGVNWKADKEDFIKQTNVFDRLNLRFSYGHTGNVVTTTSFVPLVSMMGVYPPTGAEYATINDYGNPTLTWERTKIANLGVDFVLRSPKISGTIELYNKHGVDIVGEIDLPRLTGTTLQEFNTAEILNRGVELSVNYDFLPKSSWLSWLTRLNFTYNKSEVLSLKRVSYSASSIKTPHFEEGQPVGAIYSYKYLGMNTENLPYMQGIGENTWTFNNVAPSTNDHRQYMIYSGSTQPTTMIGWQNTISAYGFNLSVYLTGEFGHIFRRPTFDYPILTNSKVTSTLHKDVKGVLDNISKDIPTMPSNTETNLLAWGGYAQYLNTTIENASNIRLQEINLSYNLPAKLISTIGFSDIKLYCQVRNVGLLWTANKKGLDPLYILNSSSAAATTLIKPARIYTFGLSFEF